MALSVFVEVNLGHSWVSEGNGPQLEACIIIERFMCLFIPEMQGSEIIKMLILREFSFYLMWKN